MPQTIQYGNELIRINPINKSIDYSTSAGKTWHVRYKFSSSTGQFQSLCAYGSELLAITSIGLFYSTTGGKTWHLRNRNSSTTGDFVELINNGKELLAETTVGLFYSINCGKTWHLKKRK